MLWFVFAALSALFATGFTILARVLSVKSDNPTALAVVFGVCSAVLSLLLFVVQPISFRPLSAIIVALTLLSTIFYGIYDRSQFYARKYVEASLITIVSQLTPVATFLVSLVFFREQVTLVKVLAFLLIIGGNLLVVYKNGGVNFNKGIILAIISATALGIAFAIDKRPLPAGLSRSTHQSFILFRHYTTSFSRHWHRTQCRMKPK